MSKNNFQERLRKMEDTKQRFSIRKFSIGAASVLIGLTIFGMGNETVHAAEQPAQNQNGGVQTSAVNKEESDASKAKQEAETSVNVNSEVTENMQEVSVDQKANTAQLEKKAPASAVKEEKTVADPTPAKERNATSKQDSASAQTSQPAVDSVKQNAKKTQQVGNDKAALATTINSEKTQQAGNGKAALATTITLNEPKSSVVELTKSKATVQDENSTTVVTSAKGLIDAIQKGTANTINIGANIDLGTISSYSSYINTNISNKRNIIIQSVAGKHYTVDFNRYGFNMYSSDYGVTFKNLDLYGRSYYGIVRSAGSYTFDNVNYTGSELIYIDPGYNTTVNFDGNVTAHSVGSYTTPLNSRSSQKSQGGDTQQVIQFAGGTKNTITINFNSGSNVTLTTTNSNVVEVDKGTTTINVKNGAQVSLNPHTQIFTEQHRMRMDGIARGIASDGNTTLNIDQGGNLDINLTKNTKDWYLSGALYLNSGATINVNGNLNINSNGKPYYRSQGWDDPVYINGKATINVNGGSFKVNATNIGDYKGSIVTSNGTTTIAIKPHGTFDVTGDGAKATGVSLGNGSTFTSTQPELFNISMPDGATAIAIKNGKVQFNGVKTSADSQPIGEIDVTYNDGIPKVTTVTSYDEATTTATRTAVNKAKNKINLVAAGKEVDLKDIMFTKDADGNYIMSGIANTADNNGAYVYISVNGTVHQVAPTDSQTLYTVGETGDPTPSQVPYTAETGADGEFSVNLGKLKDTDQVSLYAAKDFVTSDKDTKTVSEWMTSFYRDQLQKLVDEASTVEVGSNYINATDSLKTAYANAISDGSAFLQNPSATSEQLEAAATAITTAKTALNGDLNKVKQDLEAAVDAAPDFENTSATYYNAASAKQQAYNTAISDGSEALKAQNPTVESLTDALNKINEAKSALDGQPTDKQALQAAVNKSKDVKDSNNYANADQNAKTAYDNAVTAAQGVLDNSNATQAQVTQALQDLNTANGKLNGDAKTEEVKQALEAAVDAAPDFENTSATYYNAASAKQQAYNTAISDGSEALKAQNPTVESLTDALNKINEAKSALDGQPTDKQALQAAVNKSKDVKDSNNYANADQNAKTAYDNAVTAAQGVLDNSNATQAQVTQALQDLNTANGKLNGDAKTEEVKQALEAAVDAAPDFENTSATYYNAASAKQQAYNTAISDGSEALKAQNPTVESLTDALNKINEAKSALDGQPTDKQALQAAVNKSKDVKDSNNYANADQNAKTAYDNAVTAAQGVLDNSNATQAQVTQALQDLNTANGKLNGDAKTEEVKQALEAAVDAAPDFENTSATYYNAASAKQQAYNTAISDGSEALKAQNPTVESLTDALNKINEAKSALDGQPTDKQALQAAVNKSKDVKDSNNYANADQNAKTAYDNAVTAAQGVLDNSNATQAQVTQALQDLNTANGKLNGDAKTEEVKQALEAAVDAAPDFENTSATYYNAASAKQQAYNTAISDGSEALKAQNPTVESLTDALNKINEAKSALDGQPTDKQALQAAVNKSKDVKDSNNYANADQNAKTAYDNAVTAAQGVLDNSNATQAQVTQALQDLNTANGKLNGDAKTEEVKQALEAAVDAAPDFENTSATYYNAASAKQQAYNTAISDGSEALKAQNPTVESLTDALNKINEAKSALDGQPTDKQALQAAVNKSKDVKDSNNYANADQNAKTAYDNAVTAAQGVLDNSNATQAQVTQALQDLNTANGKLNGDAKTEEVKQALEAAVDAAPDFENTSATYYNAASAKQQAYNTAISDGSEALKAQNPTVESLTDALNKINEAKSALDGQPTDKQALQAAVNKSKDVKDSNNYANADQNAKTAYDNAVTAAQGVLDNSNATQAQVTQALQDLNTANGKLNGDAKTEEVKQALEAAVDAAPDFENTSATYYNAASAKQQAYNTAISDGSEALKAQNPTVESLTDALNKINEAKSALDGQPTDKQALQAAVNKSKDVKDSNNYANADQNAKTAYDNAVTAAQGVLDNSNATQAQVTQALQDLNTANGKLNGDAKTEEVKQALEAAVDAAPDFENTSATYYNAASAKQQAYNTAISDGSEALKAQNPTVESLTDALNKINEAKSALDGQPTDKQALQAAVNKSKDVKDSNNYANADQNAKTAYDNAVTAAQGVLDNSNATQAQVTQALQDLNTANGKLNGDAKTEEVKQALEAAVDAAPDFENTSATYYNAASAKQQAYNTAISDGSEALKAQNPTVESLTDALNKINEAKSALDGQPTDKQALQAAVNKSKDVKDSNNYANADQNAKTAYDNAVTAAQGVLDNSNATQAQVTQALQDLNTANGKLNGDAKTEEVKQALEAAVDAAPDFENTSATYYNAASAKQQAYNTAISDGSEALKAQNPTVESLTDALNKINEAKSALDGQPTDKQALQAAVNKSKDVKDSNNYANADQNAKTAYDNAVTAAQGVLDNSNATQAQVTQALQDLNTANGKLNGDAKTEEVKQALEAAVDAAPDFENTSATYYNAASAKQQAYNTAISDGSEALKAQNPTVESLTDALNKINEAKSALDGKATDTSKLKAAVDNANTVKASNDYKDASADDQKQYDDAVKAGQQLLDPTTAPSPLTQADVDRAAKAITDAQSALTTSATTNVKDAKGKATADLTNAVDASKKAIDQDTNLTEDERNAAKAQVDSDASAAKEAINKATTNDAVTSAATAGKVTIDKTVANAAIDNAAAGKNKAIDGSSLTDEEKNGIKDQVAQAVKTAKDIISAADTEQAVTTAQKNGVAAIDGIKVPTESATKIAADKAIDEALANKQAEINKSTTLTDEEKANLNQQAQNAANTAKQNIANAKTDSAVATAQENGVAAIDGIKVPTESATKTAADKAIDEALANKQAEINKSTTLTDEEKANLNQQAQNAANTAKQNIANAKTDSAVATAQDNGVAAIDGIKVSANSTAKDQAKSNITDAADKAKQTIDQDNNLTNDQKQAAKAQVDADAKTAQEAINKATTNDDVTSATNTGKLAIDKAVANAAIDNAVAGKKAEISNAKDLSSDDVKALNNEVDQAANDAKNAISSATTEKAVKTAQTDGVDKINAIDVATTAAKDKAKSDIDQTANDAKKAIDDNKDLTDDQKTAAKDQIDQDATKAKDNINNAKTDKDVEDANNAGQLAIAKDGAKAAIQGALNKKLNEIDSASALTSDEKAKLTNDANTAATNANKAIDAATTPIEVTSAQTAGIQDIENVKVPAESTTKDQAKSNITDAADKAKQTIDQDNNLTNDQKQAAKDQVDTDAKNAQDAIDNAKTDADVNNAADNGKIAIDKTVADAAIDNAVAGKIKDVKAPLTTDEQKTLTDLIKETGENAKQNIANATTPAEVTIAQDAGVNAIDQINVPTTSPVKDAADKAIDEALKNKTAAINKADNITDQEKHSLIDKVNKAADDATSAIKNATTDNAVKDAETKGLNEINGVTIPTLAEKQQAANVAIDQAAKAKKAEIAKALQAGNIDQAKADSLNTEVDNDVTNAMKAIANATTNAAVVVAQNDGIHKIKAIKVPSSTYNPDITNNTSTGSGDTDSTSTKPAEEATLKLILTHNAYICNKDYQITYKDNKRVVLKKGTQIIALDNGKKYLIKGKEFYRIGDNQYVKVSNTISYYYLVHNSFLYNKHGKTIKRNGKRILVRKGVRLEANKVKVVKINGKKFYKVGKSTYIKFRNVKLIISPNN